MENLVEIILVQIDVDFGNPKKNINRVKDLLKNFRKREEIKHTILLLPELFTTGYDLNAIKDYSQPLESHKALIFLQDLAKDKKIWLYASIPEKEGSKIYNTGVFIDLNGEVVSTYRKIHLFKPLGETEVFQCGNKLRLRNLDTDIYLLVAEWPISRIDHWETLATARAIENQAFFIGLNRVGTDKTATYGGNSLVIAPNGEILGKLGSTEGILSTIIDLQDINESKKVFVIKEDA
ncbi:MAG: nitrilase-related carbon-nitrogen hydrolase [Candidatus Hodarchaeales archaeon]|jgi:predicted amidohydrolase